MTDPKELYSSAIKKEIEEDPMNLGYKGKSEKEIMELMNNPWFLYTPVQQSPRIATIIDQIPFAPNSIYQKDIADAKISADIIKSDPEALKEEEIALANE